MNYALDLETACNVEGCPWHGEAMCKNDHSLSPWHSKITVIGVVGKDGEQVFRGPTMIKDYARWINHLHYDDTLTMHNGKFDVLHLAQKGVSTDDLFHHWKHDTFLSAFVWTEKIPQEWLDWYASVARPGHRMAGPHSLKTLAPYFLKVKPFWEVEDKDDDEYVLTDTRHTRALNEYLQKHMPAEQQEFVNEKLLPWTKLLVQAELEGMKLDVPGLLQYKEELETIERQLKAELDKRWADAHATYSDILRQEVNRKYDNQKRTKSTENRRTVALSRVPTQVSYESPSQMLWLLSEHYGYDTRSLDGTNGTGKEILQRLSAEGHEDVGLYLKWRKTQKLLTAFIPSLLELKDSNDRLHPIFNPAGARTGRLSCERPNAQQIPKELKKFFSPGEGRVLLGYDAKAIEAKLIAAYTEDDNFCKIVLSGESFHDFNAKTFFELDCPVSEVAAKYPKERRAAKTIGFAVVFGAGANRIRIAMNQAGFNISQAEAKRIYKKYRETYAGAFEYSAEVVELFERGEVINNLLGRPLKIQNPQDCFQKAMNLIVQSSASDINLDRALALCTELKSRGIDARPHLFIHDFIGVSVLARDADESNRLALTDILPTVSLPTKFGTINIDYEGSYATTWT